MSINVMSLIIFLSGTFIFIYGLFFAPTEEEEKLLNNSMDDTSLDELLTKLENKIGDADKILGEMDKFSEYITTEMQDKYKEMLYLYQMIDDKEKNIKKESDETKLMKIQVEEKKKQLEQDKERKAFEDAKRRQAKSADDLTNTYKAFYSPNTIAAENKKEKAPVMVAKSSFDDVVYMYENGKDIDEIAKTLNKGKGEIRLMLDLMGKEG